MPTKQVQNIVNYAKLLAYKYAIVKDSWKNNPAMIVLGGDGSIDMHQPEGIDITEEIENLLFAVEELEDETVEV